jgi:hypothetical protein
MILNNECNLVRVTVDICCRCFDSGWSSAASMKAALSTAYARINGP